MKRTAELIDSGFPPMDALHVACAECGGVEVFLTTDDKLLNQGRKQRGLFRFLRQFGLDAGDYSAERHEWLDKLSLEQILDQINRNRR